MLPGVQQQMPGPAGPGGPGMGGMGGMPDIADIKGLVMPAPGIPWVWVALAAAGVAVLAGGVVWFMRHRSRRAAKRSAVPDRLGELAALRRSPGIAPGELYGRLGEIVREQLAEKYLMHAEVMNRAEITAAADRKALPAGARAALEEFLGNLEAVLYAGVVPDAEAVGRDLGRVELFVRETMSAGQGDGFEYAEAGEDRS